MSEANNNSLPVIQAESYAPTHTFDGPYIDADHAAIAQLPRDGILVQAGIPGWLQVDDALKLYEMAYFSGGNVLEVGTYQGLSTSIMAQALLNSGKQRAFDSIELNPHISAQAFRHLHQRGLDGVVKLHVGDGAAITHQLRLSGADYGFSFVDHSHAFEDVLAVANELKLLMKPGSFVVFHDFTDPRNSRRTGVGDDPNEFGVRHACDVSFDDGTFRFEGTCGACGLFRRM